MSTHLPNPLGDLARGLAARFGADAVEEDPARCSGEPAVRWTTPKGTEWEFSVESFGGRAILCIMWDRMFGGQQPCVYLTPYFLDDTDQLAHFVIVTLEGGEFDPSRMRSDFTETTDPKVGAHPIRWSALVEAEPEDLTADLFDEAPEGEDRDDPVDYWKYN